MFKRALVTGATGFVGSHLVNRLLKDGWEVGVTVRSSSSVSDAIEKNCALIASDTAPDVFAAAVQSFAPDTCFHLATMFVGVHKPEDISTMITANVEFGTVLADALSTLPSVAFVNVGTIWQHHDAQAYSPSSLYAATKQAFTAILQYYVECTELRATTIELSDTYGPEDPRKKLLQLLVGAAKSGTALQMSPGEQLVDFTHIDDVVAALLRAAELADNKGATYGIHGNGQMPLKDFTTLVASVLGQPVPVEWGAREYRPREMMKPWTYSAPLPGWAPAIGLEEGLNQVLKGALD